MAESLMGDTLYTNPLLLGYAWQKGWLPLTRASLERAIELNGIAVAANLQAFLWGRRLAERPADVLRAAGVTGASSLPPGVQILEFKRPAPSVRTDRELDELIERRSEDLTRYQSARYAQRYRALVERVRRVENDRLGTVARGRLAEAVARYFYKLMAYKDEYEVARLMTDPAFRARIDEQFEGDFTLNFHLAPPLLARVDPKTGRPRKIRFGPWLMHGFRWLPL